MAIKLLQPDGDIFRNTDKAGRHAEENSGAAMREFTGWDTGAGLKDAHNEWELQVKSLMNRLDADREALEGTKRDFQYLDLGIRSRIAQIDAGPDPRHTT
ncbi:hypothetical protein [Streptomyces vastus]|uniref:WXG100 family type VII secretion target n=1 Tax=Streptomyces vastus TaxID=285451 RepID=A0ABN3R0F6_9ACTN